MAKNPDLPVVEFEDQERWERWLEEHCEGKSGVWLKLAKKWNDRKTVTYIQALEAALSYGWIDSQARSFDDRYYLVKFTPRGPGSIWSKGNKDRALALINSGRMKPAGIRQVEAAKANGKWELAYGPDLAMNIPPDFQKELDNNRPAAEFWQALNRTNRYAIVYQIETARRERTRRSRIEKYIGMLSRREKLLP